MHRHGKLAAVLIGVFSLFFCSPAFGQAQETREWVTSSKVTGCGPGARLITPSRSADYYSRHPQALTFPGQRISKGVLQRIARRGIHWRTTLKCRPGRPGQPLDRGRRGRIAALTETTSPNWSGYESLPTWKDNGWVLDSQMGWTVPKVVEPSDKTVVSSIWPGIGTGNSQSDPLIQVGTEQDGACELGCTTHQTTYSVWYEIFPQEPQQVNPLMPLHAGDEVFAYVGYNSDTPGQADFLFVNQTTGDAFDLSQQISGSKALSGSTIEWITERTESCGITGNCTYPSLNNFGTLNFTSDTGDVNSGHSWPASQITTANPYTSQAESIDMTSCAGALLADTGPLTNAGGTWSYTTTWRAYGPTDPEQCKA